MNLKNLNEQVISTQVRVKTDKAGGSGTILYSKGASTYVLTCHHVIEEAISVKTEWAPPPIGRDIKKEYRKIVTVEFFDYSNVPHGHRPLNYSADGDVVAYDKDHDMALIKLRTVKPYQYVAKIFPLEHKEELAVGQSVCAVGAALLHDPIITFGQITHVGDEIDYKDYWMSNASIIFGNSGGAVFLEGDPYQFIGVPSRVDIVGWGTAVTHLGYFSPIHRVYQFLRESMFDFIVDDTVSEKECEEHRKQKEEEEQRKLTFMPMAQFGQDRPHP